MFGQASTRSTAATHRSFRKLGAWKHGFNSPFKAEVYFVNTKQFTDLKWGTSNPVMMRDTDFGMVRLRAFGIYSIRVTDPRAFIKEIAGTNAHFVTEDIEGQLKRTLVSGFSDALAESKIAALDLASNYDELGKFTRGKIAEDFKAFGLELTKFVIENISLPAEVEAAMDKRTSMGVIGDVGRYAQFQAADAMRDAAQNTGGGGAATGAGLGAGFAIGNAMAGAMTNAMNQSQAQAQVKTAAAAKSCVSQVRRGKPYAARNSAMSAAPRWKRRADAPAQSAAPRCRRDPSFAMSAVLKLNSADFDSLR